MLRSSPRIHFNCSSPTDQLPSSVSFCAKFRQNEVNNKNMGRHSPHLDSDFSLGSNFLTSFLKHLDRLSKSCHHLMLNPSCDAIQWCNIRYGKKKSLLPNVSFLDEFSQEPYYAYKGTFGKKRKAPSCHNSRKNWLSSQCLSNKKWCHAIQSKASLGKRRPQSL